MCSCDISHDVYEARTLSAEIAPRDVICNMNVHSSVVMTTFAGYDPHLICQYVNSSPTFDLWSRPTELSLALYLN